MEYDHGYYPDQSRGRLEWETDYIWRFERSDFTLRNEVNRDRSTHNIQSELSLNWFYQATGSFKFGFELEVDYYDNDSDRKFDIFEIELEPTIFWTKKLPDGKFRFELEAPITRLYSNDKTKENFKVEGMQLAFMYQRNISKDSRYGATLKLLYSSETHDVATNPEFYLQHYF